MLLGDNWDQPQLVCSPVCPQLQAPALVGACSQTLVQDSWSTPLSLGNWFSPLPLTQGIGITWFAPDGVLEASNRVGCADTMVLLTTSAKLAAYVGDFSMQALISPQGATQAGLAFFSDALANNYVRFSLDASGLGVHALEFRAQGRDCALQIAYLGLQLVLGVARGRIRHRVRGSFLPAGSQRMAAPCSAAV